MSEKVFFFAGIGGIGMSALAKHLLANGHQVFGFDRVESKVTQSLEEKGAKITFSPDPEELPETIKKTAELTVIYTPALAKEHPLLQYFKNKGLSLLKRSEFLEQLSLDMDTWAVAGTHGKTTTSALLTHLLRSCGEDPTAFLGGIMLGANTNFFQGASDICVVEADEYDRSFLRLQPHSGIITSMEPDHLDIYGNEEAYVEAFQDFRKLVKGKCLVHHSTPLEGITYGGANSDHRIENLQISSGAYHFRWTSSTFDQKVTMNYPGRHNLENALAALALCAENGLEPEKLARALEDFPGVWRRFEKHFDTGQQVYYDDYAHHPGELKMLIDSLKELHPEKKLTLIFQPHLFSRTQDFMDEFALELSRADSLILLPIYPAREEPIEGITSEALLEKCSAMEQRVLNKEQIVEWVGEENPEMLVTAGAGDIDRLVAPLAQKMNAN